MILLLFLALLPAAEAKPAVSVLYFENQTGKADFDLLKKGIADMIVTDLVAWDGVTVVERQRLEQVMGELKLQSGNAFDPTTRQKMGKLLGASFLLTGTFNAAGNTFAIDAQLIEVQSGAIKVSARVNGTPDKVFDLEQELVFKISAGIDARLRDAGQRRKVKVPSLEALLLYSKAIDLSDQGKLDEAQNAMQEVVSKSPGFLLAREKKKAILENLKESKERRRDIISGSILELGKIADQAINQATRFDELDEEAQRRHLAFRMIKARFLAQLLRQYLSTRDEHFHVMLKGKEKDSRQLMLTWAENQRRLKEERDRYIRAHTKVYNGVAVPPSTDATLDQPLLVLIRDSQMGNLSINEDPTRAFAAFVLEGDVTTGEQHYRVGPALGDLDREVQKEAFDLLDGCFKHGVDEFAKADVQQQPRWEYEASSCIGAKASALIRIDRDEDAVAAHQSFLDAFPASKQGPRVEESIEEIIGSKPSHERTERERWAKALETCEDMDIRVGMGTLYRRMRRMGLAGLDAQAAKRLESKCTLEKKTRSAFEYAYQNLALDAGRHEDCERCRAWFSKYLEVGGSVQSLKGYEKNYVPWCRLGDIAAKVSWMFSKMDQNWDLEMNRGLTSVLSHDRKVLTLNGQRDALDDHLSFRLEATATAEFRCKSATWTARDMKTPRLGTCEVELKKLAKEPGDFDEGTYSAAFEEKEPYPRTIRLEGGQFRLRRQ